MLDIEVQRPVRRRKGRSESRSDSGYSGDVSALFGIVRMGGNDEDIQHAQQAVVLRRMARDLSFDVKVKVGPTIRERDGLAMSSRNDYLTAEERAYAPHLYQALRFGRRLILDGERRAGRVRSAVRRRLAGGLGRIDYVELVDAKTLERLTRIERDVLLAVAVFVGKARLIDNLIVRPGRSA